MISASVLRNNSQNIISLATTKVFLLGGIVNILSLSPTSFLSELNSIYSA
jgi:hypothetical protein